MDSILQRIVDNKRREIEARMAMSDRYKHHPADMFVHTPVSMKRTLLDDPYGIIAEFKRRSPSKGEIHPMASASEIVAGYADAGASACSILTDTPFFGGALTDLDAARAVTGIPLLRKEFIISPFQIHEARMHGADAILLIAAILTAKEIDEYINLAHSLDLEVLLELHDRSELAKYSPEADMTGVNNRNLSTFQTDPGLSMLMARELPETTVKIAESGLTSMMEITSLRDAGYRGFLIGERFMKHPDPASALRSFINTPLS